MRKGMPKITPQEFGQRQATLEKMLSLGMYTSQIVYQCKHVLKWQVTPGYVAQMISDIYKKWQKETDAARPQAREKIGRMLVDLYLDSRKDRTHGASTGILDRLARFNGVKDIEALVARSGAPSTVEEEVTHEDKIAILKEALDKGLLK